MPDKCSRLSVTHAHVIFDVFTIQSRVSILCALSAGRREQRSDSHFLPPEADASSGSDGCAPRHPTPPPHAGGSQPRPRWVTPRSSHWRASSDSARQARRSVPGTRGVCRRSTSAGRTPSRGAGGTGSGRTRLRAVDRGPRRWAKQVRLPRRKGHIQTETGCGSSLDKGTKQRLEVASDSWV